MVLLRHVKADGSVGGFEQRGIRGYIDGLRRWSEFHLYVDGRLIAETQGDSRLPVVTKAGFGDSQDILARRESQ